MLSSVAVHKFECLEIDHYGFPKDEKKNKYNNGGAVRVKLQPKKDGLFIESVRNKANVALSKAREIEKRDSGWYYATDDAFANADELSILADAVEKEHPAFYVIGTHLASGHEKKAHQERLEQLDVLMTEGCLTCGKKKINNKFQLFGNKVELDSLKNSYSVNKIRGPGSNQPHKVGDYELQLIDLIFTHNINVKEIPDLGEIKDGRDNITFTGNENLVNMLPNPVCRSDHLPVILEFSPLRVEGEEH